MMRRKLFLILVFLVSVSLSACSNICRRNVTPQARVVTRITISQGDDNRSYSSEESMASILSYLRHLSPMTDAGYVLTQGTPYHITLIYSDGSHQDFLQRGLFFQDADGTWKQISEHDVLALSKLFDLLEPETVLSAT